MTSSMALLPFTGSDHVSPEIIIKFKYPDHILKPRLNGALSRAKFITQQLEKVSIMTVILFFMNNHHKGNSKNKVFMLQSNLPEM